MSEFTCANGHLMLPSKSIGGRCHICGARCVRMDGMTDREMKARDEEFDRERKEEAEECGTCDQPMSDHDDGECPKQCRED